MSLHLPGGDIDLSERLFHLHVIDDLQSAIVLGLHCPESVLLRLLLPFQLSLLHLLLLFLLDACNLVWSEAFEVVGLKPVVR